MKKESKIKGLSLILEEAKRYWYVYIILLILNLVIVFSSVLTLEAIKNLINGATVKSQLLIKNGAIYGTIGFSGMFVLSSIKTILQNKLNLVTTSKLEYKYISAVTSKNILELEKYETADLSNRVSESISSALRGINLSIIDITYNLMSIIIYAIYIMKISKILTVGSILLTVAGPIFLIKIGKKVNKVSKIDQKLQADLNSYIQDDIQGIETLKLFNMSDKYPKKIKEIYNKFLSNKFILTKYIKIANISSEFFFNLISIFIIGVGCFLVIKKLTDLGSVIAFLMAYGNFIQPIMSIGESWVDLQTVFVSAERINEIFQLERDAVGSEDINTCFANTFSFDNVSFTYRNGKNAIKNMSFQCKRDEVIAIVGESGAGKSTILKLILGLVKANSGDVMIDDTSVKDIKDYYKHVAYVSQKPYLFNDSIYKNTIGSAENVDEKKLNEAYEDANLSSFTNKLENKHYTVINESNNNISIGQKQRITIARAFYKDSAICVYDEMTSSLDKECEKIIFQNIMKKSKGKITFISTHNLNMLKEVHKILFIKDGTIDCIGNHQELYGKCDSYRKLYDMGLKNNEFKEITG